MESKTRTSWPNSLCYRSQKFCKHSYELQLGALTSDRHPWGGVRSTLISQDVHRMNLCHKLDLLSTNSISFQRAEHARDNETCNLTIKYKFIEVRSTVYSMFFPLSQVFALWSSIICMLAVELVSLSNMPSKLISRCTSNVFFIMTKCHVEHKYL